MVTNKTEGNKQKKKNQKKLIDMKMWIETKKNKQNLYRNHFYMEINCQIKFHNQNSPNYNDGLKNNSII